MKLLLDTTYIMPLADVETEKFRKEDFKVLVDICNSNRISLLLSPLSLVELKWVIIKLGRRRPRLLRALRRKYRLLLRFVLHGNVLSLTPLVDEEVDERENELLDAGITDYFDRMIFATALCYADALLTEDDALLSTWAESSEYKELILAYNWSRFKREFKA